MNRLFGMLFLLAYVQIHAMWIDIQPLATLCNTESQYSLINSVEFHPRKHLLCVTLTHNNKVNLYQLQNEGGLELVQSLSNPTACLSEPQHAVFSPDGTMLIVANWTNQTFTLYQLEKDDRFCERPALIFNPPSQLIHHKPHGIAFSPCGKFLAVAYGAADYHDRAIALFQLADGNLRLTGLLDRKSLPGIPKGITFSPDGKSLLVSFSDCNCLIIYDVDDENRISSPKQCIQGPETAISRPEDIKLSSNGRYCAVSNSDKNTVAFYSFDQSTNRITQSSPCLILQNPEAGLCFPHGISFSADGSLFAVTMFGPVNTTPEGDISWLAGTDPHLAKVHLYKIRQ